VLFRSPITYIGGLVGYDEMGSCTNSYWDTETSGTGSSALGEGKTTAEMKTQSNFTDWDFVNIWNITEGVTYPYFIWKGLEEEAEDTINPNIEIIYPENTTYTINVSELNYSYYDENPDSCWYSRDNGETNSSIVSAGTNFTDVISIEGSNTWILYCNDTFNNQNSTSITFIKSTPIFIKRVEYFTPITLNGGTETYVTFSFITSSFNVNETSGKIRITHKGEERLSNFCVNSSYEGENIFACVVSMQFYDSEGSWNINATLLDNSGNLIENSTKSFIVNALDYITQDTASIIWSALNVGTNDNEANNTITLTNGGNQNYSNCNIKAYDLKGINYDNLIDANKFSIDNETGKTTGQIYLQNNTNIDVSSKINLNSHGSSVTTEIFFYVDIPTGIREDSYLSNNDWEILFS
jgi:hypothetical protein